MKSSSNDRLGASLFPAPSSQQRVPDGNGNSRNKVALKPGRSLMDWIRLTHSGQDLTGVGGKRQDVTLEELAKHGKVDDAWICLKGKVYNVTSYMEFHPGGQDELMRGVGKDATDLFNEVHKWVNFESMLEKCLVGRLKSPSSFSLKGRSPLERDLMKSLNLKIKADNEKDLGTPNPSDSNIIPKEIPKPNYDWFQTEKSVSLVVYTKCKNMTTDRVSIDVIGRIFRLLVKIKRASYLIYVDLDGDIAPNVNVKIGKDSGAIEILLSKRSPRMWSKLGKTLESHDTFLPATDREIYFRECVLTKKCQLTHDTFLFTLEIPEGTMLNVPVGHHIRAKISVKDMEVVRSYTPVTPFLSRVNSKDAISWPPEFPNQLHLMVKIYPDGALTPVLDRMEIGNRFAVGDADGSFEVESLEKCQRLSLLAAGTGFTPMVKLISRFLLVEGNDRRVKLMFFNKTENDIPWRDQMEMLSEKDSRFDVQHVLSEPSDDWQGLRGRIRARLLENFLPSPEHSAENTAQLVDLDQDESEPLKETNQPTQLLICVCGPTNFTNAAIGYLKELGYNSNDIFAFKG